MKKVIFGFVILIVMNQNSFAQQKGMENTGTITASDEQQIIQLSKDKWQWMSDKNTSALSDLFHEKAVFVHMGGSWGTEQELNVISSGGIWYKKADIHDATVNVINQTAILLNKITLLAVVGGNEVTNSFVVTEVYVQENGKWKLGALSFTKLNAPPAMVSGSH